MKSKVKYKSLLVMFGSLLISICIEKLIVCIGQCIISPNAFRYCLCDMWSIIVFQLPRLFFATYTILILTCLSVTLLCLMKGKLVKELKHIVVSLVVSIVIAAFWTIVVFLSNSLNNDPPFCYIYCTISPLSLNAKILFSFVAVTLIPAFVVMIVASIWAYLTFKKKFMLHLDDTNEMDLNQRILLLPFLLVILQLCNSVIVYFVTVTSGAILSKFDTGDYYGSFANVIADFEYLIFDLIHCLSFPLTLLYLYTSVKKTWKKLVCKVLYCQCIKD